MSYRAMLFKAGLIFLMVFATAHGLVKADSDLTSNATNPVGDVMQLQLQYTYGPEIYGLDGESHVGVVQPVIPFDLPFESMPKLITRTTIPYVSTPDLPDSGSVDGLGDIVFLGFFMPKLESKGQMFGFGPALLLPTATEDETGTEKWAIGPSLAYINLETKGWMWGLLSWAYWDFAGEDDRDHVAQYNLQPVLLKFFPKGWYAGLLDIPWTYDDNTNKWNVPIGPRVGRVTKIGQQSMNIFVGAYYNPVDTQGTAEWAIKLSFSFLFPM
jgi:Putative MetA-pathway of phenol degradation